MKIKHKIEPEVTYSFKSRMNRENAYVLRLKKCLKELEIIARNGTGFARQASYAASNAIQRRLKTGLEELEFDASDRIWFLGYDE